MHLAVAALFFEQLVVRLGNLGLELICEIEQSERPRVAEKQTKQSFGFDFGELARFGRDSHEVAVNFLVAQTILVAPVQSPFVILC